MFKNSDSQRISAYLSFRLEIVRMHGASSLPLRVRVYTGIPFIYLRLAVDQFLSGNLFSGPLYISVYLSFYTKELAYWTTLTLPPTPLWLLTPPPSLLIFPNRYLPLLIPLPHLLRPSSAWPSPHFPMPPSSPSYPCLLLLPIPKPTLPPSPNPCFPRLISYPNMTPSPTPSLPSSLLPRACCGGGGVPCTRPVIYGLPAGYSSPLRASPAPLGEGDANRARVIYGNARETAARVFYLLRWTRVYHN